MRSPPEDLRDFVDGLRAGDEEVVTEFCRAYGGSLQRIAGRNLASGLRRRLDPEDIVQSALRTFFRRTSGGQLEIVDADSLWRLLCAITLTKVRKQARFQLREKRSPRLEVALDHGPDDSRSDYGPAASGPTPDEVAEFADEFDALLGSLDTEERKIVELRLTEHTHEQIAEHLVCSQRTVRRILQRVRARLEHVLEPA